MPRTKSPITKKRSRHTIASNGAVESVDVLTLDEAAAYLRIPAAEVVIMIGAEGLPARKFGAEWRFYKAALQTWLSAPPPVKKGLLSHLGEIKDDPHFEEMLRDIYAQRGRPEAEED